MVEGNYISISFEMDGVALIWKSDWEKKEEEAIREDVEDDGSSFIKELSGSDKCCTLPFNRIKNIAADSSCVA